MNRSLAHAETPKKLFPVTSSLASYPPPSEPCLATPSQNSAEHHAWPGAREPSPNEASAGTGCCGTGVRPPRRRVDGFKVSGASHRHGSIHKSRLSALPRGAPRANLLPMASFGRLQSMWQTSNVVVGLAMLWSVCCCPAADDYQETVELGKAANAWKQEEPIPAKLLEYKTSWREGSCFPDPSGTEFLFSTITNYSLMREVVFLPELDARVFSNAVRAAVQAVGPSRFFTDSLAVLEGKPGLRKQDRFDELWKQAKVRHVVVDSLYITFSDMSPGSAKEVLNEIAAELRRGKSWHDVYWKFMEAYEGPSEYKFSDGTTVKGKRSKIGNLGDFVLPANGSALFSFRKEWMPKEHARKLLSANAGDILVLFDKEDLSRFPDLRDRETGERYVLHRVREVYGRN
jgi:hypothetical protein